VAALGTTAASGTTAVSTGLSPGVAGQTLAGEHGNDNGLEEAPETVLISSSLRKTLVGAANASCCIKVVIFKDLQLH
jgi:hypothetical protein